MDASVGDPIDGRSPFDDRASRLESSTWNACGGCVARELRSLWPMRRFLWREKRLNPVDSVEKKRRAMSRSNSARVAGSVGQVASVHAASFSAGRVLRARDARATR